jgi:hypothetical protein
MNARNRRAVRTSPGWILRSPYSRRAREVLSFPLVLELSGELTTEW